MAPGRKQRRGTASPLFAAASAAALLLALPASAQESGATGSLERFQPAPAGDPMFGVSSPWIEGHLLPRAVALVDFAYRPLSVQDGETRRPVVAQQTFLHVGASIALFDRLLVSLDMPFALTQSGDSPVVEGVSFTSPQGAEAGDLRLGGRVKLVGGEKEPFQIAAGGYLYAPTGPNGSYAGDGSIRGAPELVIGGKYQGFLYSVAVSTTLRASERPNTFDARAGAAMVFSDGLAQVGPELSLSTPFSDDILLETETAQVSIASPTSVELLFGVKLRPLPFLVLGAGAGPGLTQGFGTPVFFAVGSVGYEPPPPPEDPDTDKDGIADSKDACPKIRGVRHANPARNGCPPDPDNDAIYEPDDACPNEPGKPSNDPKKNGCPPDTDGDGIYDAVDACPKEPGKKSDDPKKHGCPFADADNDGIADAVDACPNEPGQKSDDPKKHGCPPDRDDDGVPDAVDACPDQRGGPDADPKMHGCPHVTVTETEIVIKHQVQFKVAQASLEHTVDPVSEDLLTEVRNAILDHPEIELIEVQGHADVTGPEDFNQRLSQVRADAVRRWLIKRGIPAKKLISKGYGSTAPVASNESEKGRQENRRVQFMIIKKKAP
ncbi:MAG TPA: OmpA family protein [Polyangiaceae bacterium]|nr:OmpA family protein [Polyangiaceae bacterium]